MKHLKPFPESRHPLVFAHRGVSSLFPENSLSAFREAARIGCPGVELDIHLCATGELVVFHDDTVDRVCGTPGRIEEMSLAEIKRLDIGAKRDPRFAGERIPLLSELFAEVGDRVYYDIEIKSRSTADRGMERKLSALIDEHGLAARVAVSSFNPISLRRFKEIRKDIPTAIIWCEDKEVPWILRGGLGALIGRTDYLKPDWHCMRHPGVYWLGAGLLRDTVPWTVDDADTARLMLKRGVAGVISNRPQDLSFLWGAEGD